MTFSGTRFPGLYLLLQGLAIAGWWAVLLLFPESRSRFVPAGAAETELLAFLLPDLVVVAFSLAAAAAFFRRTRWVVPLAWFAAGGTIYSAAYCLAWSWLRNGAWGNVALMSPAALLCGIAALDASPGVVAIFRSARSATRRRHLVATLAQISAFWSFFLLVVPSALVALETRLGWLGFDFPFRRAVGVVAFLALSTLGLMSGLTMSSRGDGTPLPIDATNRLVVAGPYAYLRNPMVVAGLGQGLGVALLFGSWVVVAYVILGGLIWNYLVRPAEEQDLLVKFSDEYAEYCKAVRCWLPRRRRYIKPNPHPDRPSCTPTT